MTLNLWYVETYDLCLTILIVKLVWNHACRPPPAYKLNASGNSRVVLLWMQMEQKGMYGNGMEWNRNGRTGQWRNHHFAMNGLSLFKRRSIVGRSTCLSLEYSIDHLWQELGNIMWNNVNITSCSPRHWMGMGYSHGGQGSFTMLVTVLGAGCHGALGPCGRDIKMCKWF